MRATARRSTQLRALLEQQPMALFHLVPGRPVHLSVGGQHFEAANATVATALASEAKRLATLRARVALQGGRLELIDGDGGDGEIVVTIGAQTQRFGDLSAASDWLKGRAHE